MQVRVTPPDVVAPDTPPLQRVASLEDIQEIDLNTIRQEDAPSFYDGIPESIDFSNGLLVTVLSYITWGVVFVANAYAIVMLCLDAN